MIFRTSLKQTLRMPVKLIAYFLVTALAAAFLCVGLTLERNSQRNLAAADNCFTTIAVPEAYHLGVLMPTLTAEEKIKYRDPETGKLDLPQELVSYVPIPAWATESELDLTPLREAPGVERIDLRGRFGARVNGETQLSYGLDPERYACMEDVVIFSVDAEEPIVVRSSYGVQGVVPRTDVPVTLLFSANRLYQYAETLPLSNHNLSPEMLSASAAGLPAMFDLGADYPEGSFVLQPGKQYIALLSDVLPHVHMNSEGNVTQTGFVYSASLNSDAYHTPRRSAYSASSQRQSTLRLFLSILSPEETPPYLPIAEYYDGFFDTEEVAYYKEVIEAYQINSNSLTAIATGDMAAMRPFHSGEVYLSAGRAFTEEEYAAGAKVCVVSAAMAEFNGWEIGDTLSLSFYDCPPIQYNDNPDNLNPTREWQYSAYTKDSAGFFDEGEYEIVGLFGGRVERGQRKQYNSTIDKLHMVNVILPDTSVEHAPAPSVYKYTSSIRLENSEAVEFITAMQASGLTESAEDEYGRYELRFTVYDQGYSHVAPGLEQLSRVSRLMLLLSLATAGAAALALALIHVLRMRRELAAMRSLGTKKGQIAGIALLGVLLVCLLGAAAGAYAGHALSTEVAEHVLAGAEADAADRAFTAMMGEETAKEFAFTLESDAALAFASGGGVAAAFLLLALLLLAAELRRPPMALLAVRE